MSTESLPSSDLRVSASVDPGLPPTTRLIGEGALDHPECVVWDATEGCLLAGGEDGQVYRIALDGSSVDLIAHAKGAFLCGLALDARGDVYACDIMSGTILRVTRTGQIGRYGATIGTPNYPVFAANGVLYVSQSGTHNGANGNVVRILPGGTTERVPLSRPLAFANGLALRDGLLYIAESDASRIVRVPVEGGEPETVVEIGGTVPDGLAFDADGALWIACYQPNRVYRLRADGELEVAAEDPGGWMLPMPTNLCFAGEDLSTIVVACLGGWFLTAFDAPSPGLTAVRPSIPEVVDP